MHDTCIKARKADARSMRADAPSSTTTPLRRRDVAASISVLCRAARENEDSRAAVLNLLPRCLSSLHSARPPKRTSSLHTR
eukprot:361381-Chlamydomonas_euryale.AAC.2